MRNAVSFEIQNYLNETTFCQTLDRNQMIAFIIKDINENVIVGCRLNINILLECIEKNKEAIEGGDKQYIQHLKDSKMIDS